MNSTLTNSIVRFFVLWILQVFILQQVFWGWGGVVYLQVFLYPLFILLLPIATPRALVILLGFFLGIAVDWLYESPGMHASALVFTAYMRGLVFRILEPREGYAIKDTPTKKSLGDTWFFQYAALLLALHLFFYYSVEAFTYVYFSAIVLKTIFSWLASLFFVMVVVYLFNPES